MATTVFRVEKNRDFVVMHNKFLREKQMSLKAKGLLALCLALPENWEYSLNGLCAICKESQTSIRSALKELETFKYLKRERRKDSKGQFIYEYIIYEMPYSGFVHTDKQHTEKQHTENHLQQNKDKENIKKQNNNNKYNKILELIKSEEMRELYLAYAEMREAIKAPLTVRAMAMLIDKVERLAPMNIPQQKELLENAILNNWKSVYLPSEKKAAINNSDFMEQLKEMYKEGGANG